MYASWLTYMLTNAQIYEIIFVDKYVNRRIMEKDEALKKIGLKIKQLRDERKISQQDLGAVCNFEKSSMSRIESGRTNLTVGTLLKIGSALNVKLVDIVDVE